MGNILSSTAVTDFCEVKRGKGKKENLAYKERKL